MVKFFSPVNIVIILLFFGIVFLLLQGQSGKNSDSFLNNNSEGGHDQYSSDDSDREGKGDPDSFSERDQEHPTPTPEFMKKDLYFPPYPEESGPGQDREGESLYRSEAYGYQFWFPSIWSLSLSGREEVLLKPSSPGPDELRLMVKAGSDLEDDFKEEKEQLLEEFELEIKEEVVFVDQVLATKYIIDKKSLEEKSFLIFINRNEQDYLIEYLGGCPDFLGQAEQVVANFEFK